MTNHIDRVMHGGTVFIAIPFIIVIAPIAAVFWCIRTIAEKLGWKPERLDDPPGSMGIKQVLVMRDDLGMSPGKLAAQTAHASIAAYDVATPECIDEWKRHGVTKVVLRVGSETGLLKIYKASVAAYLPTSLICDEGRTEVTPGSITGVGIGPAPEEEINEITGKLQLWGIGCQRETN